MLRIWTWSGAFKPMYGTLHPLFIEMIWVGTKALEHGSTVDVGKITKLDFRWLPLGFYLTSPRFP